MTEERRKVLSMLSEGKVTVAEAERLLEALQPGRTGEQGTAVEAVRPGARGRSPRYLRIQVNEGGEGDKVNIRVPLQLLRAGIRLKKLIPHEAQRAMADQGIDLSGNDQDIDEVIQSLSELVVDVDEGPDGDQVRIFCE
ncbi:MAG TPA: hypothetical protein VM389_11750 [Phycisphaerae bacterium]|nr:hypothetical protein [Phycisphaerae bacterium]